MYRHLPRRCNLEHLKKEAKAVHRIVRRHRDGWRLADAQHAVARGYGFSSWSALKTHVESVAHTHVAAGSRIESRRAAIGEDEPSRREHPIAGTWMATAANSASPQGGSMHEVLSIFVTGHVVALTHVMLGRPGHQSAVKMAIRADGRDHPLDNAGGRTVQARWINARLLDMNVKSGDHSVARAQYELSKDGGTLTMSTAEHAVVFERG